MSNKPLTRDEQKRHAAEQMKRRKKQIDALPLLPPFTVIFSEGTKTEPYYISGLVDKINRRFSDFTKVERIAVEGTGRNTRGLLSYAEKTAAEKYPQAEIIWLMFDKDDFPYDDFDNTINSTESRKGAVKYRSAWSNECIELWFLLHFNYLDTNNGREWYCDRLSEYLGFHYDKSCPDMYELLESKTDDAIRNAKRLIDETVPPSRNAPATKVYELVEELRKYLL